jgi:ankyrin repeat protein
MDVKASESKSTRILGLITGVCLVIALGTANVIYFVRAHRKVSIHEAVEANNISKVQTLLKLQPDLISSTVNGKPLLFGASSKAMLELLLLNHADVNCTNGMRTSALHSAARQGNLEVVEALLAHGADVTVKDSMHGSVLLAASLGSGPETVKIAELLLAHGADVNAADALGYRPLLLAAMSRNQDLMELLISHGADVNARDYQGITPLHWAVPRIGLMELLLSHNVDVNAKDQDGLTPLDRAVRTRRSDAVQLLIQSGGQATNGTNMAARARSRSGRVKR